MNHHAACGCKYPTCPPRRPMQSSSLGVNSKLLQILWTTCFHKGTAASPMHPKGRFTRGWGSPVLGCLWERPAAARTIRLAHAPRLLPKGLSSREQEGAEIPSHAITSALGTRESSNFNFSLLLQSDADSARSVACQTEPPAVST